MEPEVPVPSADGAPSAPTETPEPSLAEHEAQFHAKTDPDDAPEAADTEPAPERARGEDGKFQSQSKKKATPADVPRIQELSRQLRDTRTELETLRRQAQPTPQAPRPPALPPQAQTQPPQPSKAPRLQFYIDQLAPHEDYNLAVERHAEAVANWTWQQRERQAQEQQAQRQFANTFTQKIDGARAKYQDFDEVALNAPSNIPQGSLVDRWIWEHKTGADVLYYFQSHPDELPRVLAQGPLDQLETLALLAQQLSAPPRRSAGVTGSAAPQNNSPAPRPPNPVRTGPMRGGDEPPGDDAPLSAHEKYFYPHARRR